MWGLCVVAWLVTLGPVVRDYVEGSLRGSDELLLVYVLAPWCGAYFGGRAAQLLRREGRRVMAGAIHAVALSLPPISILLLPAIGLVLSVGLRLAR